MGKYSLGWKPSTGTATWAAGISEGNTLGLSGRSVGTVPAANVTRTVKEPFSLSRLLWGDNSTSTSTNKKVEIAKNGLASGLLCPGVDLATPPNQNVNFTGGPLSFVNGDTIYLYGSQSAGSLRVYNAATVLEADGKQLAIYTHQCNYLLALFSAETTIFLPVTSGSATADMVAEYDCLFPTGGTAYDPQVYVSGNGGGAGQVIFTLLVDGAASGVTITIGTGVTGEVFGVGTANIPAGAKVKWQITSEGAGFAIGWVGFSLESSTIGQSDYCAHIGTESNALLNTTSQRRSAPVGGFSLQPSASFTLCNYPIGFSCSIKNLWVHVSENTLTGGNTTTISFAVNGVAAVGGPEVVVSASSGTGFITGDDASLDIGEDDVISLILLTTQADGTSFRAAGFSANDGSVTIPAAAGDGGVCPGPLSEGVFEDNVWDIPDLNPRGLGIIKHAAPISGGPSLAGHDAAKGSGYGFWEIVLSDIPITSRAQVLNLRAIEAKLTGRIGVAVLHFCDGKRAPWPVLGGSIVAEAASDFLPGDTTGNVDIISGSALMPGMHFSTDDRLYRIVRVGTPVGSVYPVTIWPKVRELIMDGDTLDFEDLKLRVRLKDQDAFQIMLEQLRYAFPTIAFVEDVLAGSGASSN